MHFKRMLICALLYFLGNSTLIHAMEKNAKTPVHNAVLHNSIGTLELLKNAGADMNAIDETGLSPLHLAVHCEQLSAVRQLLSLGARLDITTTENITEDVPESTIIPNGSTVFHLAEDNFKAAHSIKHILLYHALFAPKDTPIEHNGLILFFGILRRTCPSLYTNRFHVLMPYFKDNLSPESLVRILGSRLQRPHEFARTILKGRVTALQHILYVKNANGVLAQELENSNKRHQMATPTHFLLTPELYDEELPKFIRAAQNNELAKLTLSGNVIKIAYDGSLEQNTPPASGVVGSFTTIAQSCVSWVQAWFM